MTNPKLPASSEKHNSQNDNLPAQTGFKEIDLRMAYRALIDGFLQSGMEETDNDQNQRAKPDDGDL
jgi:hypothetical protein